jgi:glycosyltransferase involved in cell wall biosynthesis
MRILFITITPSPYIVYFCNQVAVSLGSLFNAIYCSKSSAMQWDKLSITHGHTFLNSKRIKYLNQNYLIDFSIWQTIKNFNPEAIIVCGFQFPMILGIIFSIIQKRKLYFMSDAWELKEKKLSPIHKLVRKISYKKANGFYSVSQKGKQNFINYNVAPSKIFIVPYTIDIDSYSKYSNKSISDREYDILFSGQFIPRKMPLFFAEIAKKLKAKRGVLKILIIGSGPMENEFLNKLSESGLEFYFAGFIEPNALAEYYAKSKLLLFTTIEDSWGVVANEAVAASTPVIISPNAGAAGEIVQDGVNGFILPLDSDIWADKIDYLLNNRDLYGQFQKNCQRIIKDYSAEKAVNSFMQGLLLK